MRINLHHYGYNTNYRYTPSGSDTYTYHSNTQNYSVRPPKPRNKLDYAFDELNSKLRNYGGIACLDEHGNVVTRYTEKVALIIDGSAPINVYSEAFRLTKKILEIMGASEDQIQEFDTVTKQSMLHYNI